LKRFPEIGNQQIRRPILITGWYRTGSTYLQNLLWSHPNVRTPLFWELRHPCPAADPRRIDSRKIIRKVKLTGRIHRYLAPRFEVAHPMQAEKPEECLHLFENACSGTTPFVITEAKSFAWWLLRRGIRSGYHFYKIQLQLLNWLRPGAQWVLKWPYHLWHLDSLLTTFPDAIIIHLHRNPCAAIASVCSLAALARSSFCKSIDHSALGKFWLDYCEAGLRRGLAARAQAETNQILDIRYPDLMRDPQTTLVQILKRVDLDEGRLHTAPPLAGLGRQRRQKAVDHRYALSQFEIDADEIRERFGAYIGNYDLT
jgi:hypothetical protein